MAWWLSCLLIQPLSCRRQILIRRAVFVDENKDIPSRVLFHFLVLLRCLAPLLRCQACVVATRVHNSCVCDLCRVRVLVRLSHPRPSVVTAPVYRGCPAGTHWGDPVSRVRPDQSANSCCACRCAVVRRCVVSVGKSPSLRLLDSLSLVCGKISSNLHSF